MTNWTDLIDTDPVAAAKTRREAIEAGESIDLLEEERLLDNLAALCEEFAKQLAAAKHGLGHTQYGTKDRSMKLALMGTRNPDGSRRFPEVK